MQVRRANVVLDIPDYQKSEYLAKGFDVVDDKGRIIVESFTTNDPATLHKKLNEALAKIETLQAENVKLKKLLESKPELKEEDEEPEQGKPVKGFTPINQRKGKNSKK